MIQTQTVTRILRKSTPALVAAVMAIGLLASAPRGLAATMTWTNGNDVWTSTTAWQTNEVDVYTNFFDVGGATNILVDLGCLPDASAISGGLTTNLTICGGGGTGGPPQLSDYARFTNDTSYTVTINVSTNVGNIRFLSTAGVVTLDAGVNTLTSTGQVRIADTATTSTVVWAGGTLSAAGGAVPLLQIAASGSNNVGTLIVTNGTVVGGGSISVGTALGSVGNLVVSGAGVFTNAIGAIPNNVWNFRLRTAGSQLIITNGGKFFWADQVRAQVGSLILVSDANSSLSCTGIATSTLTIGDVEGPGSTLIISNGAKAISDNGTVSIGRNNGSSNTGIVVGAGSQLISRNAGSGAGITIGVGSAAHRNNDLVVYDGGYVYTDGAFFNISGTGTNCSFHMGGVGAMSTGFAVTVRANSQAVNPLMAVTNAVFTCSVLGQQGVTSNNLTVLSKGTLIFSNQYAVSATTTNVLNGNNGIVLIDAGTINAVSGTNAMAVNFNGGCALTIRNGGKLLSELGTIGSSSSSNTGVVTGVGSVWSNSASLNVGDSGTTINNALIINGGIVSAGSIRIRPTNAIVFTAGTLSAGDMRIEPGANGSNVFVAGDGTSAAYYDMAAGGVGYHRFSNGGLVVTNNAFLRGSGTLTGPTRVLGTFVPGFAGTVGSIFSSNSISFGSSTVLEYDLGTSSDSVTIDSTVGLGNSTLNVSNSGGFAAVNYVLFTHTNTVTAPSGTLTVGTLPAGFTAIVSNDIPNAQVLLVVSAIGGGDPYDTWLTNYGLTPGGNGLGTADPDGDGMINTNEFLAGFNPTNSTAYLHVITVAKSGSDMNVTYLGASGDSSGSPGPKTNVLESTTGTPPSYTNNWLDAGQTNVLSGGTGFGSTASFVVTNGATGAARYYRVRVLP